MLQPGLSSDDLRRDNGKAVPNLHRALSYEGVATSWSVVNVAGEISVDEMTEFINDACAKQDKAHLVEELNLPALPAHNTASKLAENGSFLYLTTIFCFIGHALTR